METTRTEHLWVISVLAAVMLPSVSGSAEVVNGTLGSNITLEFRFDSSRAHTLHHVGLYYGVNQKKAECKASSCPSAFEVKEASATVQYHLSNLSQGGQSGVLRCAVNRRGPNSRE
ncbi:hypothetical protein NQD34_002852 [Periophthalmus magnuspinnatus]|nr:hypothetical protein NQD34_002852 [Periophthalmus magnuspinnatus]